jgi:non-heme Fe2+,alpha-ketoglutarate-dependent halogenase
MLSKESKTSFRTYGVVPRVQVMPREQADLYHAECVELSRLLGGAPRTIDVRQMHLHFPWAYQLSTQPAILDAIEEILGPNLLIWATELFAKKPNDPTLLIGWHRDLPYMGFDSDHAVTAWVSLARSFPENGCMQVVLEDDRRARAAEPPPPKGTVPAREIITDVVLEPGEMSIHDLCVWHGSEANRSDEPRVGFAIRFVTPEAKPKSGRPPAVLVRGRADGAHFEIVPPPGGGEPEDLAAGMRESARRHFDAMLENLKR